MHAPGARNTSGWAAFARQRRLCQRASDLIERDRAREALDLVKEAFSLDPLESPWLQSRARGSQGA